MSCPALIPGPALFANPICQPYQSANNVYDSYECRNYDNYRCDTINPVTYYDQTVCRTLDDIPNVTVCQRERVYKAEPSNQIAYRSCDLWNQASRWRFCPYRPLVYPNYHRHSQCCGHGCSTYSTSDCLHTSSARNLAPTTLVESGARQATASNTGDISKYSPTYRRLQLKRKIAASAKTNPKPDVKTKIAKLKPNLKPKPKTNVKK